MSLVSLVSVLFLFVSVLILSGIYLLTGAAPFHEKFSDDFQYTAKPWLSKDIHKYCNNNVVSNNNNSNAADRSDRDRDSTERKSVRDVNRAGYEYYQRGKYCLYVKCMCGMPVPCEK